MPERCASSPNRRAADSPAYLPFGGGSLTGPVRLLSKPFTDLKARGAIEDGTSHPLSTRFSALADAQAAYPLAGITSLSQEIDWAVFQDTLNGLPMAAPNAGGTIVIDGHLYLGNDGIVTSARSVQLLNFGGTSHGYDPTTQSGVISGTGTQVLITITTAAGATEWAGWRTDNITFRDINDSLTGLVRLVRRNKMKFFNVNFDFATTASRGYAVCQDGGGTVLGTGLAISAAADTVTAPNHGLVAGARVMLTAFVPVAGIDPSVVYYVVNPTTNTIQLSNDVRRPRARPHRRRDRDVRHRERPHQQPQPVQRVHLLRWPQRLHGVRLPERIPLECVRGRHRRRGDARRGKQSGSIGMMVGSSMRAIGANIQGFERNFVLDGNNPTVSDVRCDNGAGLGTAFHIDVLATAKDAKIVDPSFGGVATSSGFYMRFNLGHTRTTCVAASSNATTMAIAVDPTDTQLTMLDSIRGLTLGLGALAKHASGVLQAVTGIAGKTKAGTLSDADYAAAPPDGAWGVNTTAGTLMFRSGGGWKTLAPTTGSAVGKIGAATSQALVTNSTTETTLASITLPGGSAVAGSVLRFTGAGSTDNIATSGTLTIKVKIAGVTVAQFAVSSASSARTAGAFGFLGTLTFRTVGGTATIVGSGTAQISLGSSTAAFQNNQIPGSTFDSRIDQAVTVTAQWGTADPGNTIRLDQFLLELA